MAYDEKKKEATMAYLKKLKQVRFWVKPEEYDRYQKATEEQGYPSVRSFIMTAIEEKIQKTSDVGGKENE